MKFLAASLLSLVGMVAAGTIATSELPLAAIQAVQATTVPESPTSNVNGVAFNRFFQIWLEESVSAHPQFPLFDVIFQSLVWPNKATTYSGLH